jgi:hypothetical protein
MATAPVQGDARLDVLIGALLGVLDTAGAGPRAPSCAVTQSGALVGDVEHVMRPQAGPPPPPASARTAGCPDLTSFPVNS